MRLYLLSRLLNFISLIIPQRVNIIKKTIFILFCYDASTLNRIHEEREILLTFCDLIHEYFSFHKLESNYYFFFLLNLYFES